MNLRLRFAHLATTSLVAVLALELLTGVALANPLPATTPPTTPAPAPIGQGAPTDPSQQDGLVESWALAPGGSPNPDEAGNRPELSYQAAPGATLEDYVTVFNYGNVTETFHIYATDAFNNTEGQFDLLPGDQQPVDAGSWVQLPQSMVTVPPGKQVSMPITIKIPADANPGDHTGAVLAASETTGTGPDGKTVTLDRRTGTRLYIRVAGPVHAELAVTNVATDYHHSANPLGGSATVTFRVENTGNVRLGGTAHVSVSGPFGLGEHTVTLPAIAELLPGQRVTMTATVKDVGALLVDSTTVRIEPTGVADVGAVTVASGSDTTFAPPLALLVVLLLVIAYLIVRRRRNRRDDADDVPPATADDRELQHA